MDATDSTDLMWESALIHKVKQHPPLYDLYNRQYRKSRRSILTWLTVAKELGMPGQWRICKDRWRTLRDVYVRNRKSYLMGGKRARNRPRWKFFQQMNFLNSYIYHKPVDEEKKPRDERAQRQRNHPEPEESPSDTDTSDELLLSYRGVTLQRGIQCKSEDEEEAEAEEDKRDTKRARFGDTFSTTMQGKEKRSAAVEDFEAELLREADPVSFTFDGRPIKQEVEWTDEEVKEETDIKNFLKWTSPSRSPTPPPPPPAAGDKKPLMFNLKLLGGKSIPASFFTEPKQTLTKRKEGMITINQVNSVPIKIKTVTGKQVRASSQASVLLPPPPPPPKQPPVMREVNNVSDSGPRAFMSSNPCPEQVNKAAVQMSVSREDVLEDKEELFGRYVAAAIRKLSSRSNSLAKMRIQQVLFRLEELDRTSEVVNNSSCSCKL